jgi:hypothetical protein
MNIYFDLCVYNRPFDDQTQPRIMIETTALLIVMSIVQTQEMNTLNSFVLEYENSRNPQLENRRIIADMLNAATTYIQYDSAIGNRALVLEQSGIRHFDALHLACAEYADADFFVTCDDDLVRKAATGGNIRINVISLLDFIAREVF